MLLHIGGRPKLSSTLRMNVDFLNFIENTIFDKITNSKLAYWIDIIWSNVYWEVMLIVIALMNWMEIGIFNI